MMEREGIHHRHRILIIFVFGIDINMNTQESVGEQIENK